MKITKTEQKIQRRLKDRLSRRTPSTGWGLAINRAILFVESVLRHGR